MWQCTPVISGDQSRRIECSRSSSVYKDLPGDPKLCNTVYKGNRITPPPTPTSSPPPIAASSPQLIQLFPTSFLTVPVLWVAFTGWLHFLAGYFYFKDTLHGFVCQRPAFQKRRSGNVSSASASRAPSSLASLGLAAHASLFILVVSVNAILCLPVLYVT